MHKHSQSHKSNYKTNLLVCKLSTQWTSSNFKVTNLSKGLRPKISSSHCVKSSQMVSINLLNVIFGGFSRRFVLSFSGLLSLLFITRILMIIIDLDLLFWCYVIGHHYLATASIVVHYFGSYGSWEHALNPNCQISSMRLLELIHACHPLISDSFPCWLLTCFFSIGSWVDHYMVSHVCCWLILFPAHSPRMKIWISNQYRCWRIELWQKLFLRLGIYVWEGL